MNKKKNTLITIITILVLASCSNISNDLEKGNLVSYDDDISLIVPNSLSFINQDTVRKTESGLNENGKIYTYYMNLDTIYLGSKGNFLRLNKYKDSLNMYLEVSKQNKCNKNDITIELELFKNKLKDGYKLDLIEESYDNKIFYVILSSNNQYHYLKKVLIDDKCYTLYYHAFHYSKNIEIDYHKENSAQIMESIKIN